MEGSLNWEEVAGTGIFWYLREDLRLNWCVLKIAAGERLPGFWAPLHWEAIRSRRGACIALRWPGQIATSYDVQCAVHIVPEACRCCEPVARHDGLCQYLPRQNLLNFWVEGWWSSLDYESARPRLRLTEREELWESTAFARFHSVNPIPSVGHGPARHSRDVRDRARRRFVSLRFIQFMYNLRFDMLAHHSS
eukprot:scaffold8475_cov124-Isochrysis_galbana.AAC.4